MNYLLIDTSNQPLSVAVMRDADVLATYHTNEKKNHSVQLMPAIIDTLQAAGMNKKDLDAVVVAEGPGSYTGLRIGVTTAKTLAYALNIKLYGVSSLQGLAATVSKDDARLIVPIFDARRQFVFAGIYQYQSGKLVTIMEDTYIEISELHETCVAASKDNGYVYVGVDCPKFEEVIGDHYVTHTPQAECMYPLITEASDVHQFVPKYLKISEAEKNWIDQQKKH